MDPDLHRLDASRPDALGGADGDRPGALAHCEEAVMPIGEWIGLLLVAAIAVILAMLFSLFF
jgi:hypothetical protein